MQKPREIYPDERHCSRKSGCCHLGSSLEFSLGLARPFPPVPCWRNSARSPRRPRSCRRFSQNTEGAEVLSVLIRSVGVLAVGTLPVQIRSVGILDVGTLLVQIRSVGILAVGTLLVQIRSVGILDVG